jgi:hypothetical protein
MRHTTPTADTQGIGDSRRSVCPNLLMIRARKHVVSRMAATSESDPNIR